MTQLQQLGLKNIISGIHIWVNISIKQSPDQNCFQKHSLITTACIVTKLQNEFKVLHKIVYHL